jgi:hypothetical protein
MEILTVLVPVVWLIPVLISNFLDKYSANYAFVSSLECILYSLIESHKIAMDDLPKILKLWQILTVG